MKISINSTYSYIRTNINYGSTLQCYALQKYLKKRGHDPEHLRDYRANPVLILKRLKNIKWFKPFCAKAVAQFEMGRFIKDNIAVSTKGYISEKAMYKNCPKADCFIAGSDQIWRNPTGSRFLNYAPDEAIKLSYAASFGRTSLPKEIAEKIKPWLNRFDGISVREKTAVNMVESIVDKEVVQVLDPTLLLDMDEYPYANIEVKNYCYCYFLNLGDKKNVSFDEIKRYAADENMKLIVTSPSNYTLFLNENPIFPTVDKMATAVISKLETNNKTIIGAINALNSEKVGNFNIITTNVTTGAQYGDFNVYFDEKTYTEIPALIINPNKVQGVNFVLNDFLYVNNSKQINGVKLQAEKSGNWYVSKAITITIATFGK